MIFLKLFIFCFCISIVFAQPQSGVGSVSNPAIDCEDVANRRCNAPSGHYMVLSPPAQVRVWCEMDIDGGGWTRVFDLNDRSCSEWNWSDTGIGPAPPPPDGCTQPCKDNSCDKEASLSLTPYIDSVVPYREVLGEFQSILSVIVLCSFFFSPTSFKFGRGVIWTDFVPEVIVMSMVSVFGQNRNEFGRK